ncbi:MAG: hypothetical protein ABI471_04235 [Sphingomonas bacterium]
MVAGLAFVVASSSLSAYSNKPPETVGPPPIGLGGPCPVTITEPGGEMSGTEIPIAALRLGAPVSRATTSFPAGGSGTAKSWEMMRRKEAGLPYAPEAFDSLAFALPVVYAAQPSETAWGYVYQRLPLKPVSDDPDREALVFAQPVSDTRGQIVSLSLAMKDAPDAAPKLRVISGRPLSSGACQPQTLDVYAPAMTAGEVRSLFSMTGCNWGQLSACQRSQWPAAVCCLSCGPSKRHAISTAG